MALATVQYFSRSLQKASTLIVAFPDEPEVPRPWSVLYLLHGLSDDQSIWQRRTSIERYAAGLPLAIVMPDGHRGWYTNSHDGQSRYEDDLIVDVVGLVDRLFPVRAERAGRALGGLSMGGYGAVKLALKYADRFAAATSHSGALNCVREPEVARPFSPEFDRVFGPNPAGGSDDAFTLAEIADRKRLPALRLDCGLSDFLLEQNRAFHRHLDACRIAHEYQEFPGDHDWTYWDLHIREALAFHARTLGLSS